MKLNRDQYDRLNAEIEKEFNDGIDLDESKIEIKLVNDQRKPVEMISNSVFIDNKPVLNAMLKLGKRKSIDIKFSNVHSAHFDEYNEVELFKLNYVIYFQQQFCAIDLPHFNQQSLKQLLRQLLRQLLKWSEKHEDLRFVDKSVEII